MLHQAGPNGLILRTVPIVPDASGFGCVLHKDHGSAQPFYLQAHHEHPQEWQMKLWGKVRDKKMANICGTGHDTTHRLIDLMMASGSLSNAWPMYRSEWLLAVEAIQWYRAEMAKLHPVAEQDH